MEIRLGRKSDAEQIAEFQLAMALETEGKSLDRETVVAAVSDVFEDPQKGFYVVAETEDGVVGSLMITYEWSDWRRSWWWWIQSVYVTPAQRGRGIYRRLYEFVTDQARSAGNVKGIRLYVETNNTAAQRVYEKLGMNRSPYLMYDATL
jgi:GNAT superfamily N-acetyltransferase